MLRGLAHWGLQTSSDAHESSNHHPHDNKATPVIVLGFARTGTTTIQTRLARGLQYNSCFEPFARGNHRPKELPDANHWFMGAPDSEAMKSVMRPTGCALSPDGVNDANWEAELRSALLNQIQAIHKSFGWNCVWKEIRLVPTLPAVREAYKVLGRKAWFVGVVGNPLGCVYAYYRLLALGKRPGMNGLHPGTLWEYRRAIYKSIGLSSSLLKIDAATAAESLVLASLIDQEFLHAQANENARSTLITSLSGLPETLKGIAADCGVPESTNDVPFLRTPRWATDPWFKSLVIDRLSAPVQDSLFARWPMPKLSDDGRSRRAWWTSILNRGIGLAP